MLIMMDPVRTQEANSARMVFEASTSCPTLTEVGKLSEF